jgi:hypothetical protein
MNIHKAPSSIAVIPFYATAAIAFLSLCIMLFLSANEFNGHYFQPKILALTHTAALGWGTMIIFGASYQLLPVIFEKDLYSAKLAFISFLFLLPGTALLVFSFWNLNIGLIMQIAGALIIGGIILFAVNVFLTSRNSEKYSIQKLFIMTSAVWLLITGINGILLVFNFSYPIFRQSHLEILKLHAHAGIVGWFLLLIIGVGTKLIPMFLLGKSDKEKYLLWAYYLINIGLFAFLADGLLTQVSWRSLAYGLLIIAGIVAFISFIYDVYKNRMRKETDFQMKHTMISMFFLFLAILHIPIMMFRPDEVKCSLIYGMLVFMGWITSIIIGKTFKTLPFIVWNDKYKAHVGKKNLPMPKHLYKESSIKVQFYLYLIGFALFIIGIKTGLTILNQVAAVILILVALLYNYNVFKIIFHKPQIS